MKRTDPRPPGIGINLIILLLLVGILFGLAGQVAPIQAQEISATPTPGEIPTAMPGSPVEVDGKVIFYVYQRIGSFSAADRAAAISQRISDLATNPFAPPLELTLAESSEGTDVLAGDVILLTVSEGDARAINMTRQQAAEAAAIRIQAAVEALRQQNTPRARLIRIGETLLILLVIAALFALINWLYHRIAWRIDNDVQNRKGLFGKSEVFRHEPPLRVIKFLLNALRWILIFLAILFLIPFGLRLFPATAQLAKQILELVLLPFQSFWNWLVINQKNFMTILIVFVITYLLIRLVQFIFKEIEIEAIKIHGFEKEWAPFTGRIISFLLIIGAVIVTFPYIPGSDSEAFKGITIFLGALFTLSSTAAVGNIVAGVIQTYTGAFRVGDVVKIGLVIGIVTEKKLLTTRVRTFKNEEVSIPNSTVINTDVTNYTMMAKGKGLVLYTTVTIGYDVPWKQVHDLLIAAALNTPDIIPTPAPFVLQTSLNDFNVSYQLNCYTKRPDRMYRLYSAIHQNIQDQFNKAGVEIMSPAFTAVRDGNTIAIPLENRPENYEIPGFHINTGK
jgi:small-conductance mechanosensitive channel